LKTIKKTKMKRIILLLSVIGLFTTATYAQTKDEKEVADAVEFMRKAMISGNKADLEKVACENLSYGHSSGKIQNADEFVEAIVNKSSVFVTITLTNQTIKVVDKTAIVRHILIAQTNDGGKPGNVNLGIMLVFIKEHGNWKLLARQAYKLPVQ
jgi:PBP1b-binding outer membrane lipoprotein LpoB